MKVAIMQPYIFPYLGYFQLVSAVELFIFYDDVNYKKKGWINRNRILLNDKEHLISFPCKSASQNKLINEVEIDLFSKEYSKIFDKIRQAYKKAPFYHDVLPILEEIFTSNSHNIADLASNSVKSISQYLGLTTKFLNSSISFKESSSLNRADRLISITKNLHSSDYINAIGGKELYNKMYFKSRGVNLHFLESNLQPYNQFNNKFVAGLSIIDVIMFNSVINVKELLKNHQLV
jgi:hypothetical protein